MPLSPPHRQVHNSYSNRSFRLLLTPCCHLGRNWNGSNDNMNPSAVAVMPKATYSSTQPSVVRSATGSSGVGVSTPTSAQVHSQGYPTRSHSVAQQQAGKI